MQEVILELMLLGGHRPAHTGSMQRGNPSQTADTLSGAKASANQELCELLCHVARGANLLQPDRCAV